MPITNPIDISAHELAATGIHGVGAEYIAKTPHSGQEVSQGALKAIEDNLLWEAVRGGAWTSFVEGGAWRLIGFPTSYADKAVQGIQGNDQRVVHCHTGRAADVDNNYFCYLHQPASTADFRLDKIVAGVETNLGTEGIDIDIQETYTLKLSCSGSTIAAYREDLTTPKISVTDTSLASGYFGYKGMGYYTYGEKITQMVSFQLVAAGSPQPRILAFFEVPIIGDGTHRDPFRAKLPTELLDADFLRSPYEKALIKLYRAAGLNDEEINALGIKTHANLLGVSFSALIPTDSNTGRPINNTALIRVYEPSPSYVKPMRKRLDAIRAMPGAKELTPERAKTRARALDAKLGGGEAENFINPSDFNEIEALADFYERELIRLSRLKPEQLLTLEEDIRNYAEKAKSLGRSRVERRFKRLMS